MGLGLPLSIEICKTYGYIYVDCFSHLIMFDSPSSLCFIFFHLIALHLFVLYSPSTLFQIFMSEKQGHSSGGVCQIHREPPRCTEWPPLCTPTP